MTLIMTCLTQTSVYLMSDRRLTSTVAPYPVVDDEANKCVVVEGRFAFGYTGLSEVHGERTDDWLAKVIANGPTHDLAQVTHRIKESASEAFRRMQYPNHIKRHAFMGAGWLRLKGESEFTPGIIKIHNALDHTSGRWLVEALPEFSVTTIFPDRFPGKCVVSSVGVEPSADEKSAVVRLARKCVKHRSSTPRTVEFGLLLSMRWLAGKHQLIGPGLMSVVLPKEAVDTQGRTGEIMVLTGHPTPSVPTFSYVSSNGTRTYFGPHFVSEGTMATNFRVDPL